MLHQGSHSQRYTGHALFRAGRAALLLLIFMFSATPVQAGEAAESSAVLTAARAGELIVANLLSREHMFYGDEALHYAEAATAVGALRFASSINDRAMLEQLISRYSALLDDHSSLVSRRPHVDMNVIGIVPLQIAILTGDADQLRQGLSFADSQWDEPLENGLTSQTRWWIDDLYMVGMLQIQAFRATADPKYADRAARQLAAYLPELQQENGLFHHSPDVPVFWGRGNGWVAVAMAEVLSSLPQAHRLRPQLLKHYQAMMQSLLKFQDQGGMWRQVIDYAPSWTESSATAMFAYAMLLGIQHGLLDREPYTAAVNKAWSALTALIDAKGNVQEVCVGTGKKNDLDYYLARPRVTGDFHGQAPVLWLADGLLP
jgi:unsaturated rhamnogalacturonyl hydrolase